MPVKLSLALAQLNPTVGDISKNIAALRAAREKAALQSSDILITSELYLCAYPPEDLVLKKSFQESILNAIERLARETSDGGPAILLGAPWVEKGHLFNAALLLENGRIQGKVFKHDLPNYGPFDEKRVFDAGPLPEPLLFRGLRLGVMICEDMWTSSCAAHLKQKNADILIVPNGSPFEIAKTATRFGLAQMRVQETNLPLIYLNQLGGQDELVFDGRSFVLNGSGEVIHQLPAWEEATAMVKFSGKDFTKTKSAPVRATDGDAIADIYQALMIGLRDYVNKNGFPGLVLGLSGGIDSALAVTLACDALGPKRVRGVMLPSRFTSLESTQDAQESAQRLHCKISTVPIEPSVKQFIESLAPLMADTTPGIVSENIQARCRGLILMALSNARGDMVLSTGNKSEMSVGYATLYGDMCGGFAVLKDVYKTQVYLLARWRNGALPRLALGAKGMVIPNRVLTKAPTAELRPDQKDQDSLPPYDILDAILERLIEGDLGIDEIVRQGYEPSVVAHIWSLLDRSEYKRRQAAPGVKITKRNLSRDRRYPMTNKYKERLPAKPRP